MFTESLMRALGRIVDRYRNEYVATLPTNTIPLPPPGIRAQVVDFAALFPNATVGDWVNFTVALTRREWTEGYRSALEARVFGEIELPEPIAEPPEWAVVDYNVVPLKDDVEHEPVVLTTEDGRPYLRSNYVDREWNGVESGNDSATQAKRSDR
jgi:hypothetical protein